MRSVPAPAPGAMGATRPTLPMPDGASLEVAVEDAPIMEAALAARFPEIRTFRACAEGGARLSDDALRLSVARNKYPPGVSIRSLGRGRHCSGARSAQAAWFMSRNAGTA